MTTTPNIGGEPSKKGVPVTSTSSTPSDQPTQETAQEKLQLPPPILVDRPLSQRKVSVFSARSGAEAGLRKVEPEQAASPPTEKGRRGRRVQINLEGVALPRPKGLSKVTTSQPAGSKEPSMGSSPTARPPMMPAGWRPSHLPTSTKGPPPLLSSATPIQVGLQTASTLPDRSNRSPSRQEPPPPPLPSQRPSQPSRAYIHAASSSQLNKSSAPRLMPPEHLPLAEHLLPLSAPPPGFGSLDFKSPLRGGSVPKDIDPMERATTWVSPLAPAQPAPSRDIPPQPQSPLPFTLDSSDFQGPPPPRVSQAASAFVGGAASQSKKSPAPGFAPPPPMPPPDLVLQPGSRIEPGTRGSMMRSMVSLGPSSSEQSAVPSLSRIASRPMPNPAPHGLSKKAMSIPARQDSPAIGRAEVVSAPPFLEEDLAQYQAEMSRRMTKIVGRMEQVAAAQGGEVSSKSLVRGWRGLHKNLVSYESEHRGNLRRFLQNHSSIQDPQLIEAVMDWVGSGRRHTEAGKSDPEQSLDMLELRKKGGVADLLGGFSFETLKKLADYLTVVGRGLFKQSPQQPASPTKEGPPSLPKRGSSPPQVIAATYAWDEEDSAISQSAQTAAVGQIQRPLAQGPSVSPKVQPVAAPMAWGHQEGSVASHSQEEALAPPGLPSSAASSGDRPSAGSSAQRSSQGGGLEAPQAGEASGKKTPAGVASSEEVEGPSVSEKIESCRAALHSIFEDVLGKAQAGESSPDAATCHELWKKLHRAISTAGLSYLVPFVGDYSAITDQELQLAIAVWARTPHEQEKEEEVSDLAAAIVQGLDRMAGRSSSGDPTGRMEPLLELRQLLTQYPEAR